MRPSIYLKLAAVSAFLSIFAACSNAGNETVAVESVILNPAKLSLVEGAVGSITATVMPTEATNPAVRWTSSNNSVATVSGGTVTAIAEGNAVITATTEDGNFKDECEVTVTKTEISVTGVTLDPKILSLVIGTTGTIKVTVEPAGATNGNVKWTSKNDAIATVAGGTVTAVAKGSTTITVTTEDGNFKDECEVTVTESEVNVTGITLDKQVLPLVEGTMGTITATIAPADATNRKIAWNIDNDEVVFIAEDGATLVVYGKTSGTAKVTATTEDGGYEASCTIIVTKATVSATDVMLNKTELTLKVNEAETLAETVLPADATNKNVTWRSSDNTIATVTDGEVRALKEGVATITVRTEDGGHEAFCALTVEAAAPITTPPYARSTRTWLVGSQLWSDVINLPACNKTGFNGGLAGSEVADCRNNGSYGYLYSWPYVKSNGTALCPEGWRVPTKEDFYDLDIELGGTGAKNQRSAALREAYETVWGAEYGGYVDNYGYLKYTDSEAYYWSQTIAMPNYSQYAYRLTIFKGNNNVNPQDDYGSTYHGLAVRCVKDN